jgi:hypothetical protein
LLRGHQAKTSMPQLGFETIFWEGLKIKILNIRNQSLLIMKYCHDCLTPMNSGSKEESSSVA